MPTAGANGHGRAGSWPKRLRFRLALTTLVLLGANVAGAQAEQDTAVRFGIDFAFPPFQYVEDDEVKGFDVDLIRAVADAVGIRVEFVPGPWHLIREQLEAGEIDAGASVLRTDERSERLDFSIPTMIAEHTIFVQDAAMIAGPTDLADQTVALQDGTPWEEWLHEQVPSARALAFDTPEGALKAVESGEADAAILLHLQGLYLLRKEGTEGIRSVGAPVNTARYRFAAPKTQHELIHLLNDGLLTLRHDGTYDVLYDRWFGVLKQQGVLSTATGRGLVVAMGAVLLLLIGIFLWSGSLRRMVERRTRELRTAESDRRDLERQLFQSQKMESLGQLAGGVAHDFNNLLTAILGTAEITLDDVEPDSRVASGLNSILRAGEAGAKLTQQLTAFSRRQAVEPRSMLWNDVLSDHESTLKRLLGSLINLEMDQQDDLWPVCLDPNQALQIAMNLLVNARDAMEARGKIIVTACNEVRHGQELVRLSVCDDGEGIDAETRERIFEPFFTTKAPGKGTGLGLSTVYGIANQNGGHVEVESEPGHGATFHVWLPRNPEPRPTSDADDTASRPLDDVLDSGCTILFVDADPEVLRLGAEHMRSLGHKVHEAATGEEALGVLTETADIAVLATDVDLPGLSGLELARRALDRAPNLRVLLTGPYPGRLDLPRGTHTAFAPKPLSRERLSIALRELMHAPKVRS